MLMMEEEEGSAGGIGCRFLGRRIPSFHFLHYACELLLVRRLLFTGAQIWYSDIGVPSSFSSSDLQSASSHQSRSSRLGVQ